jgi:hypothetical protein
MPQFWQTAVRRRFGFIKVNSHNKNKLNMILSTLTFILVIEIMLKPRLDITKDEKILIWYGKSNRKFIMLN